MTSKPIVAWTSVALIALAVCSLVAFAWMHGRAMAKIDAVLTSLDPQLGWRGDVTQSLGRIERALEIPTPTAR